jgi:hypothetical protein
MAIENPNELNCDLSANLICVYSPTDNLDRFGQQRKNLAVLCNAVMRKQLNFLSA